MAAAERSVGTGGEGQGGPERRRTERVAPVRLCRCLLLPFGAATEVQAAVLDLSRGGVGLLLSEPLPPGATITLRFLRRGTSQPLELAARVAYCSAQRCGAWMVGCAFAAKLTASELVSLLPESNSPRDSPTARRESS